MAIAMRLPLHAAVESRDQPRRLRTSWPRVYSPLRPRRLTRPMAVPLAQANAGPAAPPGRPRLPFVRRRDRTMRP